jgi:hypothetical protein
MHGPSLMQRCRTATWKTWLGAALVVWLLLAESLAVTHPLDRDAHADGQPCAICLSVAHLGAGAAGADVAFAIEATAPLIVVAVVLTLLSSVPVRRYARGPPSVSFAS